MTERRQPDFREELGFTSKTLGRREFLKLTGGGIIIMVTASAAEGWLREPPRQFAGRELPADFNAFVRIAENGRVSCLTGKVELGQDISTSLAQIVAEELEVPLAAVDVVAGDTALCPYDMGTFGSRSIKYFGPPLRQAAAEARAVLLELAAERLGRPAAQLEMKDGEVYEIARPANKVTFGSLTQGKRIERTLAFKPPLKPYSAYRISGRPADRKDARLKVTGKAQYAGDIRLPGMLYARILRPPSHDASLKSVDLSEAEKMDGVTVIRDKDLIAVLHESFDGSQEALAKVKAGYDLPQAVLNDENIYDHLLQVAPPGDVVEEKGSLEEGKKLSVSLFEGTYRTPYVAHSPLEPHTATVHVAGDSATVWASTQRPFGVQEEVARALSLPLQKVRIITPFVGGGFGGKNRSLQAVEAARLAKLAGRPVQVAWSREEEFFYDTFQPAAVVKIVSGLDGSNRIALWDYSIFFGGERTSQPFYDIPHYKILSRGGWSRTAEGAHPFAVGAWRGPGSNTNTFARESHMDIMAARAGLDPVEFRLKNLKDERMIRVLRTAAKTFGWQPAPAPSGRGQGVSLVNYLNTYVATMARVRVDKGSGKVRVERLVCAQDMGQVINPDGARAQIEGCLTMGLGYVFSEELHFRGGKILDLNFDTYEITRFSRLPEIETVLIDNPGLAAQGGGEPPIVNMGAVVANAVFDACGARLTRLPLTPGRVKSGLPASKT
jgi:nicotinate dehydrogenase subunit B